ncbi:DEAD/DEAH box helicase [Draconibacterium sediminis]|uniref:DEAD/DEAH box helicase n=1 Tax=Draconibacterium sediminis TaxID=1544798 RepID=UPI0026E92EA9|nr:DEAD/DEAH box helicase [Draconibacterium sediminis]
MNDYRKILTELVENKNSWRDLKPELSRYNVHDSDTGEKDTRAGKIFEVFTKYYFLTSPIEKNNYKSVWMFEEIPSDVRNKLDLGNIDYGVDLLLQDTEGQYFAVQCKFKNDEKATLNWSADKIANLFAFCPKADGYIVFSNAADLDKISKTRHDNFTLYSVTNLQEIESEVFQNIFNQLANKGEIKRKIYSPLPHQEKAITDCVEFFEIESRGQLILPCGAGKTLTALWIKERLECANSLVLVPSLALLRQIKNEWAKQRKNSYKYICVCSENDIDKDNVDTVVTHTYEVDVHVTTDSNQIKSFLNKDYPEKVIFSTYHSLHAITEAIYNTDFEFDYIFCDEAHKTAGIGQKKFSLVHDNKKIPSKRRLYATATPRIVKESLKKKLGDDLKYAYDMNDPDTFGYEFHRMTFKDAIEQNILVDYKIVAIGVNNEELKEYIEKRHFVDSKVSIDEVANNYALEHVMNKYNANHALSFHSRVKLANEFSTRHHTLFNDVKTYAVNGDQPTSQRNIILDDFKHAEKAIVSNARCLTEGVDVPTIDLVYFCDPKNSKVDIVQAVGRALRKKDGKERGYVVIPIYHKKHDDVETSISESSFKNLLQVIRSLCDQDERLQDEINSLAFGKGKRKSLRIDITSTNFTEEQDILLLEGFEEKLKKSLFDQIIEKTSNNWDLWFLDLKEWLKTKNEYPDKYENKGLYQWIALQRNRKSNGSLKNEEIRKLNSINFAWNIVEWKWNNMFESFKEYASMNVFPPCKDIDDDEIVKWYKYQQSCIKDNKIISKEQKKKFQNVDKKFLGPASRKKWIPIFEQLVRFRDDNPDRWPQYDRENSHSEENKLSIFCQTIRKRFRENDLGDYWFEKMVSLNFNFEGKNDAWTENFEKIKSILEGRKTISIDEIGLNEYNWIYRHKRDFEEGKLTDYQSKKVKELNLDRFFETWDDIFEKVKQWHSQNGKFPTHRTNKRLSSWLNSQKIRYKNGNLSDEFAQKIIDIGFDIDGNGKAKIKERWLEMFEAVKHFTITENDWPKIGKEGLEGQMYNWCQAQRQAQAGTASGGRRKPLKDWQVEKLNSIGFHWSLAEIHDKVWENNYAELNKFLEVNDFKDLKSSSRLWRWIYNQNKAFKNGKLNKNNHEKLLKLGVDITKDIVGSGRDGFTRWANKLIEISEFINKNGDYPKASNGREELNLYNSFIRTKKAYKNGELSEKQLKFISELNIKIEI